MLLEGINPLLHSLTLKPARYIFLNRGLGMSPGKLAAQSAHSETLAMHDFHTLSERVFEADPTVRTWVVSQDELYEIWYGDAHYAKYTMLADDSTMMFTIKHYIEERGFKCYLVVDEGHTEETYMVPTAMAVELVDKDDERTASIFSNFRRYKERRPEPEPSSKLDTMLGGPFRRALRGKT